MNDTEESILTIVERISDTQWAQLRSLVYRWEKQITLLAPTKRREENLEKIEELNWMLHELKEQRKRMIEEHRRER